MRIFKEFEAFNVYTTLLNEMVDGANIRDISARIVFGFFS